MKAIDMIKRLSEHMSTMYVKTLVYEFLGDINYHTEASEIYKLPWFAEKYNYILKLEIISRKNSYEVDTWNYLYKEYDLEKYEKGYSKLMTLKWNNRVANHPENNYINCGYDMFRSFQKAQDDYSVISRLSWYWLEDWEFEEILDFIINFKSND